MLLRLIFFFGCFLFVSCSSTTAKLTKQDASDTNRIVIGRLSDINPDSIPSELQITYTLSELPNEGVLAFDNKFPRLEPKSNFFWIPIPKDSRYIGVNSIRFKLKSVEGSAIIRDDKNHRPLFGVAIQPGSSPIYIGDIALRTGTRRYSAGINAEGFDVKSVQFKNNASAARDFLLKNGFDSKDLVIAPFRLKRY